MIKKIENSTIILDNERVKRESFIYNEMNYR